MLSLSPLAAALAVCLLTAAPQGTQPDVAAQVGQAETLLESGDVEGAIVALERIVTAAPRAFAPRLALGRALDLQGRHDVARTHLEEAVRLASDDERNAALVALGISYAFEARADDAARYYQRAFDAEMQADDRSGAAGLANALGRVYLESGNLAKAEQWYTTGYETARKIPGLPASQMDLWEMRRHNAFGRIAARRGQAGDAAKHAAAVKALLDKGGNDNQRVFYPYLLGYVAFFRKDYRTAVSELARSDLEDPFILGLLAQAHERLGEREKATEYYRKVIAQPAHSINSAFARPNALRQVKSKK